MKLGEATRQYQRALEDVRAHPDIEDLRVLLEQARAVVEVAWLEHAAGA